MFVVGTEDMSKGRFIFMCLCPNLILGIIPYILFLIFPQFVGLGLFGIICIGMGFGDYLNIYNAIKQMPKIPKHIYVECTHIGTCRNAKIQVSLCIDGYLELRRRLNENCFFTWVGTNCTGLERSSPTTINF